MKSFSHFTKSTRTCFFAATTFFGISLSNHLAAQSPSEYEETSEAKKVNGNETVVVKTNTANDSSDSTTIPDSNVPDSNVLDIDNFVRNALRSLGYEYDVLRTQISNLEAQDRSELRQKLEDHLNNKLDQYNFSNNEQKNDAKLVANTMINSLFGQSNSDPNNSFPNNDVNGNGTANGNGAANETATALTNNTANVTQNSANSATASESSSGEAAGTGVASTLTDEALHAIKSLTINETIVKKYEIDENGNKVLVQQDEDYQFLEQTADGAIREIDAVRAKAIVDSVWPEIGEAEVTGSTSSSHTKIVDGKVVEQKVGDTEKFSKKIKGLDDLPINDSTQEVLSLDKVFENAMRPKREISSQTTSSQSESTDVRSSYTPTKKQDDSSADADNTSTNTQTSGSASSASSAIPVGGKYVPKINTSKNSNSAANNSGSNISNTGSTSSNNASDNYDSENSANNIGSNTAAANVANVFNSNNSNSTTTDNADIGQSTNSNNINNATESNQELQRMRQTINNLASQYRELGLILEIDDDIENDTLYLQAIIDSFRFINKDSDFANTVKKFINDQKAEGKLSKLIINNDTRTSYVITSLGEANEGNFIYYDPLSAILYYSENDKISASPPVFGLYHEFLHKFYKEQEEEVVKRENALMGKYAYRPRVLADGRPSHLAANYKTSCATCIDFLSEQSIENVSPEKVIEYWEAAGFIDSKDNVKVERASKSDPDGKNIYTITHLQQ